jgi:stage V sporulation protein G
MLAANPTDLPGARAEVFLDRLVQGRLAISGVHMLNLTDIRITKIEGDEKLRAFASIVIEGCFLVGDLRVVEGEEGFFVSMPSKRKRDGSFKDIAYPLNNETREFIERQVLLAYESSTGTRAISRIESGEESTVRPDLLSVSEFGLTPKSNP